MRFLELDYIANYYDNLYYTASELPEHLATAIHPVEGREMYDSALLLERGWEWMFEPMRRHQPKAYAALAQQQPAILIGERFEEPTDRPGIVPWKTGCFLRLADKYLHIHPYFRSQYQDPQSKIIGRARFQSLPPAIAEAYYERVEGVEVKHWLPGFPMSNRILPAAIYTAWIPADDLCKRSRKAREVMRAALSAVADPAVVVEGPLERSFWRILDTREQDNSGPEADLLLVQVGSQRRQIFHMPNFAFDKLRLVTDPVTLMDDYVSWVLLDGEGRFDFMPYSEPV